MFISLKWDGGHVIIKNKLLAFKPRQNLFFKARYGNFINMMKLQVWTQLLVITQGLAGGILQDLLCELTFQFLGRGSGSIWKGESNYNILNMG